MSQLQVQGVTNIVNAWKESGLTDKRWLAYMLATTYHETAKTMQPIEEYGRGRGKRYGRKIMFSGRPYEHPDKIYYGRGYVQLTWYENYKKMGEILNIPLLEQPELALQPDISAKIMIEGMTRGYFTGKALRDYFNDRNDDPVNARRIINGLDKANKIAEYYNDFLNAMKWKH